MLSALVANLTKNPVQQYSQNAQKNMTGVTLQNVNRCGTVVGIYIRTES